MGRMPKAKMILDCLGIDEICRRITDLETMTFIAHDVGVSIGTLCSWIDSDVERSARARESRTRTARMWDEKATKGIEDAKDTFELAKAKEIAHHYRWRASKIAPRDYGDRLDATLSAPSGGPVQIERIERVIVDPKK